MALYYLFWFWLSVSVCTNGVNLLILNGKLLTFLSFSPDLDLKLCYFLLTITNIDCYLIWFVNNWSYLNNFWMLFCIWISSFSLFMVWTVNKEKVVCGSVSLCGTIHFELFFSSSYFYTFFRQKVKNIEYLQCFLFFKKIKEKGNESNEGKGLMKIWIRFLAESIVRLKKQWKESNF